MAWYERKYAGAMLRLAGLVLLAIAMLIGRRLFLAADPAARVRATAYLLALAFMISGCAGAALAALGQHLFDQVELPARWRIHTAARSAPLGGCDPD